jgi:L,D-transpeptidase ErfK/SrfK
MVAVMIAVIFAISFIFSSTTYANYGSTICKSPDYSCYKIKKNDTWAKLFPDDDKRDLVMRINRMNVRLHRGTIIAIPNSTSINILDYSPISTQIEPPGTKIILVMLSKNIFGAYNSNGTLAY